MYNTNCVKSTIYVLKTQHNTNITLNNTQVNIKRDKN
jgi:hypothetical protein